MVDASLSGSEFSAVAEKFRQVHSDSALLISATVPIVCIRVPGCYRRQPGIYLSCHMVSDVYSSHSEYRPR